MYMKKLVVNLDWLPGRYDLSLPLADNLRNVARALGKPLDKLRMVTLDKPRLSAAIEEATQLGVKSFRPAGWRCRRQRADLLAG